MLLPLANFGTALSNTQQPRSYARAGTFDDLEWSQQPLMLTTGIDQPVAFPSVLSADGASFSARWRGTNRRRRHHSTRTSGSLAEPLEVTRP